MGKEGARVTCVGFMAEMDLVYTHILKKATAFESEKSSSLYFRICVNNLLSRFMITFN